MSLDIGEELLKEIRSDFAKELGDNDSRLAKILAKIQNGKGNLNDVSSFSTQCGEALSRAIAKHVILENLPDGKLYYNIAEKILDGTLRDNYELINKVAQATQEQTDNKLNIHIAPQQAEFPEERVHKIINAASDQTADSDTIKRRLDTPVQNVTESFYDDFVEVNAKFRDEAGLKTYLVRQTNGKCCDWCASLAGRYLYEDAPEEIFARHDNCHCTVEYISDRYRQNVWSKKKYALTPEERKQISENSPKPVRYSKEQAQQVQNNLLNGAVGVANSKNSDIRNYVDVRNEYEKNATPGIGTITYDEGYKPKLHKEEISFADWLHNYYGGDIHVLNEVNKDKVSTPDYLWNNKLWDLKTTQTEKAANSAIRKGLKQIESNPGGVILNYGDLDISTEKLQEVIDKRMQWYKGVPVDIMIVNKGEVIKILRYKST